MFLRKLTAYKNKSYKITDDFTYTAHTGCMDTKDNSLEAIQVGVENGAQIVEFDVQYLNGVPVLSHDKPKSGAITLEEAFLKIKEYDSLKVNVDIKSTEFLGTVQEVAEKTDVLDRIFFTGIKEEFVDVVRKTCPKVQYYINMDVAKPRKQKDEYLESLVAKVRLYGGIGINLNKKNATQKLVDTFHKNGMLVSIWTVNEEKDIYKILSLAPDNITTRRPDRLKKVLNEIKISK